MTYVVYILDYQTFEITIKKIVKTEEDAAGIMKQLAIDFMAFEEGMRKARIFTETPFNCDDIPKGYILFSPESKIIDVYYKETTQMPTLFGSNADISLTKVKAYSYAKLTEHDEEDIIKL